MRRTLALVVSMLGLAPVPAGAVIISTTGAMTLTPVPPPTSLAPGMLESSTAILVFDEGPSTLPFTITTNIDVPGTYVGGAIDPGFIFAGTTVNSYIVHFDPVGSGYASLSGSFTLEALEMIVGIDVLPLELDVGDPLVGHPLLTYPGGFPTRGFESLPMPADSVTWSGGAGPTVSVTLSAELGIDQMRVFAVMVPEPGSLALGAFGLVLLGAVARRRRS